MFISKFFIFQEIQLYKSTFQKRFQYLQASKGMEAENAILISLLTSWGPQKHIHKERIIFVTWKLGNI